MIKIDLIFIISMIVECVGLFAAAKAEAKFTSSKWKMLYILPLVTVGLCMGIGDFDISLLGAYAAGFLLLTGLFCEREKVRCAVCGIALVTTLVTTVVASTSDWYRCPHYVAEFETVFGEMKEYYCLTEHKGIDFDSLYEKYLPKFEEADRTHDQVLGCATFMQFTEEFHDGHVYYAPREGKLLERVYRQYLGGDYGLSLVKRSDGRYVAVNVDETLEITEGTPVLLWDGKDPAEYEAQIPLHYEMNMPDVENEAFYAPLYIAGMSGDGKEVSVTYETADGSAKEIKLSKMGDYYDRFKETLETIDQGRNIGHLEFEELDEDTVLFRVKYMQYDKHSMEEKDFPEMEKEIRENLLAYKEEGKTNLIMDLRNNGGGSPYMLQTILKLLDKEEDIFYICNGVPDPTTGKFVYNEKTGKYMPGYEMHYHGENLWDQGQIIVLTNARCISGGDHMLYMMSKMDNVILMGFTPGNSSGQAVTAISLRSGGSISYSMVPILDQEGNILIDTDKSGQNAVSLDTRILLDEEALYSLFREKEDYVLKCALETLK